jgi:hypothetical protein
MPTSLITAAHRQARRDSSAGTFIGRLNLEWETLRTDPPANAQAAAWAATDPPLDGLTTLAMIEQAVAGLLVGDRVDGIFYALARHASGSGPAASLAARILTQLMLPKAILIARTAAADLHDRDEQIQLAICTLYQVIRTFPVHRRKEHIPSHLAWDTAHAVRRSVLAQTSELPDDRLTSRPSEPKETNASEQVTHLLTWAVTEHVITPAEARLLTARYCADTNTRPTWKSIGSLSQVAAETGISLVAARQRCSRAVRRLAAATDAYPGTTATTATR